jgi:hypothetical protein
MRHLALLGSGTVWAFMMSLLFQREILPFFEFQQPPSYRVRLRHLTAPEVERRTVTFTESQNPIGLAETLVEPLAEGGALLRTRFTLKMDAFGGGLLAGQSVLVSSETRLDADYQLVEFRMDGQMATIPVPIRIRGRRTGSQLLLTTTLLGAPVEKLVDLPPDAVLSDSFAPYAGGGRLEEGKKWRMRIVDLGGLLSSGQGGQVGFTEKFATVTGREVVVVGGREVPAWKVSVQEQPNDEPEKWDYQLWVDESGTVLRQQMKINKLPCTVHLEEKRTLTPAEAGAWRWSIESPR